MTNSSMFQLRVRRIDKTCSFELSWGKNQQIEATLDYSESLTTLYKDWQRAYLSYYRSDFRGRVAGSGTIAPIHIDWHAKLVESEAAFLYEFHRWLDHALRAISDEIASAANNLKQPSTQPQPKYVDVFLTCNTIDLERLPWESWKIGAKLGLSPLIRIVRTPINITHEPAESRRRKPRILVILGDDTGLNKDKKPEIFSVDKAALKRLLSPIADLEIEGWKPGENPAEIRTKISQAIADERGWDVLFFAGHSNETELTGGELMIAPGVSMSISEIKEQLNLAKQQGLQFALFNSCSGISIATSLIDLGLSQVAVMREPIHNDVAQLFLVRFLENLAAYKDVHEALVAACQALQLETNYPSAYLIPSLFYRPNTVPFRIKPKGIKEIFRQWLPTQKQAIALTPLVLFSLLLPVQNLLLEPRLWVQAIYRDVTHQIPPTASPPVLLVSIDEKSIRRSEMSTPNPIDRQYLAKLLNQSLTGAKFIGVDYILDRQQTDKDPILGQVIRNGVKQGIYFVFAETKDGKEQIGIGEKTNIASPYWSLQGSIDSFNSYIELLPVNTSCSANCSFAYLLTAAYALNQQPSSPNLPKPNLQNKEDFRTKINNYLNHANNPNSALRFLRSQKAHSQPITEFSQGFNQVWLLPLIDFSIPPNQVFESIPAWKFLELSPKELKDLELQKRIVIIAPGGYPEAGVNKYGEDNSTVPMALGYWRERRKLDNPTVFTGSESHAYTIHHLLNQHLIIPIPDLWMMGLAALLGKGMILTLKPKRQRQKWKIGLAIATAVYGIAGLQVYISAAVLLPWLLPSAVFLIYVMPTVSRKNSHE